MRKIAKRGKVEIPISWTSPVCYAQQSFSLEREQPGGSARLWGEGQSGVGQKLLNRVQKSSGLSVKLLTAINRLFTIKIIVLCDIVFVF